MTSNLGLEKFRGARRCELVLCRKLWLVGVWTEADDRVKDLLTAGVLRMVAVLLALLAAAAAVVAVPGFRMANRCRSTMDRLRLNSGRTMELARDGDLRSMSSCCSSTTSCKSSLAMTMRAP